MHEIIDKPWVTCFLIFFLPPPSFFPCGKIVLKKEGTSVQPRSHPCTVWIRAEASANRVWWRSSDPGTIALSTQTQVRFKSKILQADSGEQKPPGGETHPSGRQSQSMGFSSRSQGHPRSFIYFSPTSREVLERMDAWVIFLLLPASPHMLL